MTNLSSISEISDSLRELLEVAGFPDAESLAKAGVDELASELERVNRILRLSGKTPDRGCVEAWIASARELTGLTNVAKVEVAIPVNQEILPAVALMLESAPFAIPLSARLLMDRELAVSDIPSAIFFNRYSGDLEVKVGERIPAPRHGRAITPSNNLRIADTSATRKEIDTSRIKTFEAMGVPTAPPFSPIAADANDRVALIRAPRVETNRGRDPQSRRYIRGVLHSHPASISFGALVTLVIAAMLPLGIISALLLLLSVEIPERFAWVPKWILVFPLSLPLFGTAYLIWGLQGKCRICTQKMFVPKICLKNSKAHRIRGLGHIIPVSIHILLFKWFRCPYCGTPVRLKK
jgi:hypothetical protein